MDYALRIYKENGELLTVLTSRTGGLKVNETTLEFESDLTPFNGKRFVLYSITKQKEERAGIITQKLSADELKRKTEMAEKILDKIDVERRKSGPEE